MFDGIRGQLRSQPCGWAFRARSGNDRSECLPALEAIHAPLGRRCALLDGEVVVFDRRGGPDFAAVRRGLARPASPGDRRATFVVWDLLHSAAD